MDYLHQLLNSPANLVIFSLDREYKYQVFNETHANIMMHDWGAKIEQGKSILEYIKSDEERSIAKKYFDRALGGEEFSEVEELVKRNLHRKIYERFYAPITDNRKIIGLTVFARDISNNKHLKTLILLESINKNIAEGIYRSDQKGLVYINSAFVRMFGFRSQEEVLSLDSSMLYKDPVQRDRLNEIINSDGFFVNEEVTFVKNSGKEFSALVSAISYTDPDGLVFVDGAIRDVTMEREADKKVRENEQLLQSINHNINEALYRSELGKGLIYVNDAFVSMFGFESEEEIIQSDAIDLYIHSEDREKLGDELVKKSSFTNIEVEFKRKNGDRFWGSLSSIMIKGDNGRTFFDGAIRDISKHKEAEVNLQESRILLESINENISEGIYRSNKKGLIYINKAFVSLFGYQSEIEVLKQKSPVLYKNPSIRKRLMKLLEEYGSFENEEVSFVRKNGEEFVGLISSTSYEDSQGNVFWDGAIRDITHQKKTEDQIQLQNQMQQMLRGISMQYINIPLGEIDDTINNSLSELGAFAGADRAWVFDLNFKNKIFKNTHEWCADGILPLIDQGQNISIRHMSSVTNLYKKGKPFLVDDTSKLSPAKYEEQIMFENIKSLASVPCMQDSKCIGTVGFDFVKSKKKIGENEIILLNLFAEMIVNIRVRTQRQQERQKLLETTTSQNERLKDFSYITSHNIRSSVANFLGLLDMQKHDSENESIGEMLQTTALKLNDTIKNINDLLNFENDIDSLTLIDCDLKKTVQHVLDLNKQTLIEKAIEVNLYATDGMTVNGIPAYLDSIFHNFLTNAIKYGTKDQSNKIDITITADDGGCLVLFKDYGLGIDMKKHGDKLFKLGTRFHSNHKDGQGLGLFMVKRHVDAMGGRIEVESKLNKGTTFKVWLYG